VTSEVDRTLVGVQVGVSTGVLDRDAAGAVRQLDAGAVGNADLVGTPALSDRNQRASAPRADGEDVTVVVVDALVGLAAAGVAQGPVHLDVGTVAADDPDVVAVDLHLDQGDVAGVGVAPPDLCGVPRTACQAGDHAQRGGQHGDAHQSRGPIRCHASPSTRLGLQRRG
jgi:hypothetical protein